MTLSLALVLSLVAALGVAAGLITTISGFGGGLLLTLALAPLIGPSSALVVAAPALAIGHVHRALGYREHVEVGTARRFILAAVPGAIVGALLAASVPESGLAWALLLGAALAVAQAFGLIPSKLGRHALLPGAAGVGFLAGSCGGGGVLLPPTLMAAGLSGRRFVATAATGALAIQVVRIASYAATGMVDAGQLPRMLAVALGLVCGNAIGRRLAERFDDRRTAAWTRSTLAIAVVLGLWGVWI